MRWLTVITAFAAWAMVPAEASAQSCDLTPNAPHCRQPAATPPRPSPSAAARPAPRPAPRPRVNVCDQRWREAERADTASAYREFDDLCSRHPMAATARARLLQRTCEPIFATANSRGTLTALEEFLRLCGDYERAGDIRARAATIRENPFDIPGLPPLGTQIPRTGLSTSAADQAARCERGEAAACLSVAFAFRNAEGAPQDDLAATALFTLACAQGSMTGCGMVSNMLSVNGPLRDDYRAAIFRERACRAGEPFACANWANDFAAGYYGAPYSPIRAAELREAACNAGIDRGIVSSCLTAAEAYSPRSNDAGRQVPVDAAKAMQLVEAGLALEPANTQLLALQERLRPLVAPPVALSAENQQLSTQCDAGSSLACNNLGVAYDNGTGAPRDAGRAARAFARSCRGGSNIGCTNLGLVYEGGRGFPRNDALALSNYERGCSGANAQACQYAANLILNSMPQELERARSSVSAGLRLAPANADLLALWGRVNPMPAGLSSASEAAYVACEARNSYADCFTLGLAYATGIGAPQSDAEAVRLYTKACNTGLQLAACNNWGVMLRDGRGVTQDFAQASIRFERACTVYSGGPAEACTNLGGLYETGRGRPRNFAQAVTFYERGCTRRHVAGCLAAARILEVGRSYSEGTVRRSRTRARELVAQGLRIEPGNAELLALQARLAS